MNAPLLLVFKLRHIITSRPCLGGAGIFILGIMSFLYSPNAFLKVAFWIFILSLIVLILHEKWYHVIDSCKCESPNAMHLLAHSVTLKVHKGVFNNNVMGGLKIPGFAVTNFGSPPNPHDKNQSTPPENVKTPCYTVVIPVHGLFRMGGQRGRPRVSRPVRATRVTFCMGHSEKCPPREFAMRG